MRRIILCTYCYQAEKSYGNSIAAFDYIEDETECCSYCDTEYDLMECMEED